ncbi:MAG: FIST C-terminal domain-containing protein [Gemmatimonadaceae bacterium]|nr:FIST C-terminal domain-containing protein [Gemmatimonadaceae bacterium]
MKTTIHRWAQSTGWLPELPLSGRNDQLVLMFGPTRFTGTSHEDLRRHFPMAEIVYVSGGGQMYADATAELAESDDVVLAALQFDDVTVHARAVYDVTRTSSVESASRLAASFPPLPEGSHLFVFTEGIDVRGDRFIHTLREHFPSGISISGGLASNGLALTDSVVGLNGPATRNTAVAVAVYGPRVRIACAVAQGWTAFGPTRRVTNSEGSLLTRLDDEPALGLYRRYLGPFAEELPGSALLFPLAVNAPGSRHDVVRSILGVNDNDGTMAFAGDVPVNSTARLMRTSEDQLIDAVELATRDALEQMGDVSTDLAICVSCIGRNAVLRSRTEEEVSSCHGTGGISRVIGFYSNGEFGPSARSGEALATDRDGPEDYVMHNQSMTITLVGEG